MKAERSKREAMDVVPPVMVLAKMLFRTSQLMDVLLAILNAVDNMLELP